jgi:hypothetical protein
MLTPRSLTPAERAMLELITARYPALAAAIEAQVTLVVASGGNTWTQPILSWY